MIIFATLIWEGEEYEKEAIGLKFECRLKTEKNPAGANRLLLDQDAETPLGKTLLIGFFSRDPAVGKTVYILTVFAQKAGS